MINSKKGGVGADETVALLLFIIAAAITAVILNLFHSTQKEQVAMDISDQLLRTQMENELLMFLQQPIGTTTVSNMIIEANYNNDFTALSEIAKARFSERKFGSYGDWGLLIQQPGEIGVQLNTGAARAIANETLILK
jgi:hypothetical protein